MITSDEIRLGGMFDEDILTDDILNSPEFIPLAESETLLALSKKKIEYSTLDDNKKNIVKMAVLENARAKCCYYMSVYILNEAKKVDKADIKYEKYASVQDWKNEANTHILKSNNYIDSICEDNKSNCGNAYCLLVPWGD